MRDVRVCFFIFSLLLCRTSVCQKSYHDSLQAFITSYTDHHELVKGDDRKYLQFFPIDEAYRVRADFKRAPEAKWFLIQTSGLEKKLYRVFGTVSFAIHDTTVTARIYQSKDLLEDPKYANYLVLMFTDKTTGNDTYDGGRYIDLSASDIKDHFVIIDFNKAYNPYCAYVRNKYNCPIPPRENDFPVAVRAGEKLYAKKTN